LLHHSDKHGRLAQLGERLPYKQDVGGSIPSSPKAISSEKTGTFVSGFFYTLFSAALQLSNILWYTPRGD
jgi:hypothetical protein